MNDGTLARISKLKSDIDKCNREAQYLITTNHTDHQVQVAFHIRMAGTHLTKIIGDEVRRRREEKGQE